MPWRSFDLHPATAVGMVMGAVLLILILVGVALLVQLVWALLALVVVFGMRRRLR